jgi:dihydrofolate reductase
MTSNAQGPKPRISIIVAMAKGRVIGANNRLPWHLSADLKRFKALTMGHTIIMGRRTYESIGGPLPGRNNVVISRQSDLVLPGVTVVSSVEQAIRCANSGEAFIIGGAEIYREALPLAQRILLTEVHCQFEGDTFFPPLEPGDWRETVRENHKDSSSGLAYDFVTLERSSR